MTGAFQNILVFMVIEFAAKMGTFTGKRPTVVLSVKEDKIRTE
jgi:hypothetical protein